MLGSDTVETENDALKRVIGTPIVKATVVIERGPVANFATAVCADNPIYGNETTAKKAGLDAIPVPPTFTLAMDTWGKFVELQPPDAPDGGALGEIIGDLMAKGGVILHGGQEFEYHRPMVVGDVLDGEGKVVDIYLKESRGRTMTFVVTETNWVDQKTGEPVLTSRTNIIHVL